MEGVREQRDLTPALERLLRHVLLFAPRSLTPRSRQLLLIPFCRVVTR